MIRLYLSNACVTNNGVGISVTNLCNFKAAIKVPLKACSYERNLSFCFIPARLQWIYGYAGAYVIPHPAVRVHYASISYDYVMSYVRLKEYTSCVTSYLSQVKCVNNQLQNCQGQKLRGNISVWFSMMQISTSGPYRTGCICIHKHIKITNLKNWD